MSALICRITIAAAMPALDAVARKIQRSKKWLVGGLVKFATAVARLSLPRPAWVVSITFCKPFLRALYIYSDGLCKIGVFHVVIKRFR